VSGSSIKFRRRGGFTLIELLVVMSIIGVLLTIAVPRYFRTVQRSKETVLRRDLSTIRESIDRYYGDLGQYPDGPDDVGRQALHPCCPGGPLHQVRRELARGRVGRPRSSRGYGTFTAVRRRTLPTDRHSSAGKRMAIPAIRTRTFGPRRRDSPTSAS